MVHLLATTQDPRVTRDDVERAYTVHQFVVFCSVFFLVFFCDLRVQSAVGVFGGAFRLQTNRASCIKIHIFQPIVNKWMRAVPASVLDDTLQTDGSCIVCLVTDRGYRSIQQIEVCFLSSFACLGSGPFHGSGRMVEYSRVFCQVSFEVAKRFGKKQKKLNFFFIFFPFWGFRSFRFYESGRIVF